MNINSKQKNMLQIKINLMNSASEHTLNIKNAFIKVRLYLLDNVNKF